VAIKADITKIDTFGKECISAFNAKCVNPGQESMKVNMEEFHDYLTSYHSYTDELLKIFSDAEIKIKLMKGKEVNFVLESLANCNANLYRILHHQIILSYEYKIAYYTLFDAMDSLKEKIAEFRKTINRISKSKLELTIEPSTEKLTIKAP
jgi:hypothetical protein